MAPKSKDGAQAKEKMRTSEDIYHRLLWDASWAEQAVIIGYEDRIEGPMEMPLKDFSPISEGGNIPFHRIWYFRRENEVLWDRRRRLDRIFKSGDTAKILADAKGFDREADAKLAEETRAAIEQALATMERLEEERQQLLDIRRRNKARRKGGDGLPAADRSNYEEVRVELVDQDTDVGAASSSQMPPQVKAEAAVTASSSCDFDFLAVLDFEATCEENRQISPQEVIEFPIVLVDARTRTAVGEFQTYVRPKAHPHLSAFCTELTGIQQEQVDSAPTFTDALAAAEAWLAANVPEESQQRTVFVTCGHWDLKTMLPAQCAFSGVEVPRRFQEWINIKDVYMSHLGKRAGGMVGMLQKLELPLEGRHHSGIDDSRNIARIACHLLADGARVQQDAVSRSPALKALAKKGLEAPAAAAAAAAAPVQESRSSSSTACAAQEPQPPETAAKHRRWSKAKGGGASAAGRGSGGPLRILTWNVMCDDFLQDDPELHSSRRAPRIAAVLRDTQFDVLALQESTPEILSRLRAALAKPHWCAQGPHGLAFLSFRPLKKVLAYKLGPSKAALLAECGLEAGTVSLANVHLTSDRKGDMLVDNSDKRCKQLIEVRAALARNAPLADSFICGDFNEPNADGIELAVKQIEGLVDVWPAVHGVDLETAGSRGDTYDPRRNAIAGRMSLTEAPRRLDRIFASRRWSPQEAVLVGTEAEPGSDHYGLLATLTRRSPLLAEPSHRSATVLLPPEKFWPQINRVREQFDPSSERWMPHINLLYGFVPADDFDVAAQAVERVVRSIGPFEVRLLDIDLFLHGRSASVIVRPECEPADALERLQAELQAAFPNCTEQCSREGRYNPHMTLGSFESEDLARRHLAEIRELWAPVTFVADGVSLISRDGDGGAFHEDFRIPLGVAMSAQDARLLTLLEEASSSRAFPVGSTALLGTARPPKSDFDILLVGERERAAVFEGLQAMPAATWARYVDAHFPLMEMEVEGVHLDIQYAQAKSPEHPMHWPTAECEGGERAAGALRDAHALRERILSAAGLAGWRQYQKALVLLKAWTTRRGIGSNALGYLGGFSWALLLADTLLAEAIATEDAEGEELLAAMWRRFADWRWPRPVAFAAGAQAPPSGAMMPILCPTEPWADSARNVTGSTAAVIQAEVRLAAASGGGRPVIEELLSSYSTFIFCRATDAGEPGEARRAAAWLEARLLMVIRRLEGFAVRPLKLGRGSFIIGVASRGAGGGPISGDGAGDAVQSDVEEAAESFRGVVARGPFPDSMEVALEDPAVLKGRL